jgi:hypothetical protein
MRKQFADRSIQEIPLGEIGVDPKYQRGLIPRLVEDIAKNFDPILFGLPLVNKRKRGRTNYQTVDGHQRLEAFRRYLVNCGINPHDVMVLCQVCHLDGEEQEARMFLEQDRRKSIKHLTKHKAAICCGDEQALQLESLLAEYGFEIERDEKIREPRWPRIVCVARIRKCLRNEEILRIILNGIQLYWNGHNAALKDMIISALYTFLFHAKKKKGTVENFDVDRFYEMMSKVTPESLVKRVPKNNPECRFMHEGLDRPEYLANLFVHEYNRGLRKANRMLELPPKR